MMNTPAPAAQQPEICPTAWIGNPQLCPAWVGFSTRTSLPVGLQWSGTGEVPAIGAGVHVHLNSFGPAVVRAYFHAAGFLGVLCEFTQVPAWFSRQCPGVTMGHFFGRELEPARAAPLNPANSLGSCPTGQREGVSTPRFADDWIPDYPPQEVEDDTQLAT